MSEVGTDVDFMKAGGGALVIEHDDGSFELNEPVIDAVGQEVAESMGYNDESDEADDSGSADVVVDGEVDETDGRKDIVLISSIAITMGMLVTGTTEQPDRDTEMPELQRLAVIGWRHVLNRWAQAIGSDRLGELLLTKQEISNTHRREEALRTVRTLFDHDETAVANENDGIAHDEITFGSNDILSAIFAARARESELFGNVRLFMLTDVNGVYEDKDDPSTRIQVIEDIDKYRHVALGSDSDNRIGGMVSKFDAAEIAKAAGIPTWVYNPADGHRDLAVAGEIGTYFPA